MERRAREMMCEQTLVLIKPDGVMRGLVGQIIQRFEQTGLKIVGLKIVRASHAQLNSHFPKTEEWLEEMGTKTLETHKEYSIDPIEILGTDNPREIGEKIKVWSYSYLSLGPMIAMVVEGIHAIDVVRKLVGDTLPYRAAPGTIRGDFSINSPDLANVVGSAVKNLIHASGSQDEAEREIHCWFTPSELFSWERLDEFLTFLHGENTVSLEGGEGAMTEIADLEEAFNRAKMEDPREAAEIAFCLAISFQRNGDPERTKHYSGQCLEILGGLPPETLKDVACRHVKLAGVLLPDFLYHEVAKTRFEREGIQL